MEGFTIYSVSANVAVIYFFMIAPPNESKRRTFLKDLKSGDRGSYENVYMVKLIYKSKEAYMQVN